MSIQGQAYEVWYFGMPPKSAVSFKWLKPLNINGAV